jgi:hypothetical protein
MVGRLSNDAHLKGILYCGINLSVLSEKAHTFCVVDRKVEKERKRYKEKKDSRERHRMK